RKSEEEQDVPYDGPNDHEDRGRDEIALGPLEEDRCPIPDPVHEPFGKDEGEDRHSPADKDAHDPRDVSLVPRRFGLFDVADEDDAIEHALAIAVYLRGIVAGTTCPPRPDRYVKEPHGRTQSDRD